MKAYSLPFLFLLSFLLIKKASGNYATRSVKQPVASHSYRDGISFQRTVEKGNYKKNNYSLESDKYCYTNASIPGIIDLNRFISSLNKEVETLQNLSTKKEYAQKLIRIKSSMCQATTQEGINRLRRNATDFLDSVRKYEKCDFCEATDQYGIEWRTCRGETAVTDCPPFSRPGYITWHCNLNLKFETALPDYSQCNNEKLGNLKGRFQTLEIGAAKLMDLEPENANEILDELYEIVSRPRDVTSARKMNIKYFGHEIEEISWIATNTVSLTDTNASRRKIEEITKKSLKIISNLLANQEQWNQLSRKRRAIIATFVLRNLESSAFDLASRNKSSRDNNAYSYQSKKDDVYSLNCTEMNPILMEFGSKYFVGETEREEMLVVSDEKTRETRITVNISWILQNAGRVIPPSGDSGEVTFVGMIIPQEYISGNLQSTSPENDKNNQSTDSNKKIRDDLETMNGKIVSLRFSHILSTRFKDDTVRVMFEHIVPTVGEHPQIFKRKLHPGEVRKAASFCAFWDTQQLKWSREGCRKINSQSNNFATTCSCNHLTAFSVLMGYHEYATDNNLENHPNYVGFLRTDENNYMNFVHDKDYGLKMLTWILCPLSILCLVLTTTILATVKCVRSDQSNITIHLCLSLVFGNLILLCADKDNFHVNDLTCTVLGTLSHYIWLCAFLWMAMQGVHLYFKVIKVFHSEKHNLLKLYSAVAYGLPLLIVTVTAAIGFSVERESIYVGEMFCWLKGQYLLWSFKIPVFIITIGNAVVLVIVLHIASKKNNYSFQKGRRKTFNKKLITGTVSLSTLLGMTWLFGLFSLVDIPGNEAIPYIFTILNASQGIFIFIFHCCLNETIRAHVTKTVLETFSFSISPSSAITTSLKQQTPNHSESYKQQKIMIDSNDKGAAINSL